MEGFDKLLDVLILAIVFGCGGYAFRTYFRLRKEWYIFNSVFLRPSECPVEECLDPDAYLEYLSPKLLVLGAVCMVSGILYFPIALPNFAVLLHLSSTTVSVLTIAAPVLGFAALVYYIFCQSKAAKHFW